MNSKVSESISNWLIDYLDASGLSTFIVGVSGGVDSAVVSTLCANTGRPVIVLNIPIHSRNDNTSLSQSHCDWLVENYENVRAETVDLTSTYDVYASTVISHINQNDLAFANSKSRLRMILLYQYATTFQGLVVGTGNKVEDFGVGFYTKYGDGGVDLSPIADLTKTDVRALAGLLGISQDILDAPPTDGLWEDSRTDEEQIGASYEELEWAMDYVDNKGIVSPTKRQEIVLKIFMDYHNKNKHKMMPIPVYKLDMDSQVMKNVSIIGIGKLGLAFALTLEKAGYNVVGVDIDEEYVNTLNNKCFNSDEPKVTEYLKESVYFRATTSLAAAIEHSDLLFVVVATPSLPNGRYDHAQVDELISRLEEYGPPENIKHFIVCCTTMPGYCETVKAKLERLNYVVSYNPEFIAQGTIISNQEQPDMVLIGEGSQAAGDLIQEVYETHTTNEPRICRMTPTEAELTKISLNCFLTTKIAYANMIGDIALRNGGRPEVILNAIGSDSRIGNRYLGYGYGYGGPCFPRDNRALALHAKDCGVEATISKASDVSNKLHLEYQLELFAQKNSLEEPIEFSYVTYKPNSTLLVESQQLEFAKKLAKKGYNVVINEREAIIEQLKGLYGDLFTYVKRAENEGD